MSIQDQKVSNQEPIYSTAITSSYLSNPDYLICEYFQEKSLERRIKLRKLIASNTKHNESILKILQFSRLALFRDAYDAGVDLLAEFETLQLHNQAFQYLKSINYPIEKSSNPKAVRQIEDFWEILTKGVSCAYKVAAEERFELVCKISRVSQRRLVKTAVIDALVTIADDLSSVEQIKDFLSRYTSEQESDVCVRDYAQEALEDLE
jgi:hypothetical protein